MADNYDASRPRQFGLQLLAEKLHLDGRHKYLALGWVHVPCEGTRQKLEYHGSAHLLPKECASLWALRNVCNYIFMMKKAPGELGSHPLPLQECHVELFDAAYGPEAVRPKRHYSMHLAAQAEAWGKLVGCFARERKHKKFVAG